MEQIVVMSESRFTEIVTSIVSSFNKGETNRESKKVVPDIISGAKNAVRFLVDNGFEISYSVFTKETAKGSIPCKRFHNKRLMFTKCGLLDWAESQCKPVGQSDATLTLAAVANRKLRRN